MPSWLCAANLNHLYNHCRFIASFVIIIITVLVISIITIKYHHNHWICGTNLNLSFTLVSSPSFTTFIFTTKPLQQQQTHQGTCRPGWFSPPRPCHRSQVRPTAASPRWMVPPPRSSPPLPGNKIIYVNIWYKEQFQVRLKAASPQWMAPPHQFSPPLAVFWLIFRHQTINLLNIKTSKTPKNSFSLMDGNSTYVLTTHAWFVLDFPCW